jgi:hypothetical protein
MRKDRSALGVINPFWETVEVSYKYTGNRGVQMSMEAVKDRKLAMGRGM